MEEDNLVSRAESMKEGVSSIITKRSNSYRKNEVKVPRKTNLNKFSSRQESVTEGNRTNNTKEKERNTSNKKKKKDRKERNKQSSGNSRDNNVNSTLGDSIVGGPKAIVGKSKKGHNSTFSAAIPSSSRRNKEKIKVNPFGIKKIDIMLMEQDSDQIFHYIIKNLKALELLLQDTLSHNMLGHVVKLIVKTFSKSSFINSKVDLLLLICNPIFMDHLVSHVSGLADSILDKNQLQARYELFNDLLELFKVVFYLLPNKATESIDIVVNRCIMIIKELSSMDSMFEVLVSGYEELKGDVICVKERWVHKKKDKEAELAPPNDFRGISLFPTSHDLNERNFLRKNKVEGSYEDVQDYLDVQFRLLREDFIDPLRVGISLYKQSVLPSNQNEKWQKNFNIRIYRNVRFLKMNYNKKNLSKISYTIQLDSKFTKSINWERSKRLLFNSLCLFSIDNFESFVLATVADRDIKNLKNGQLSVVLVRENSFGPDLFNLNFVMAESSAFFDPVYQTLNTIQMLPTDTLPMENYILVKDIAQRRPQYLIGKSTVKIKNETIVIDDDASWLKCREVGFNQSQCDALKASIRSEFCVIQGPPGTGKTYLGINLVEALLKNFIFDSPILMVCYTNHALDQFLEGLIPVTDKIVRIGNQSKNESLNQYNLKNLRREHLKRETSKNSLLNSSKEQITQSLEKLISLNNVIKGIEKFDGIINVLKYKDTCNLEGLDHFASSEEYLEWLLGDMYERLNEIIKTQLEENLNKSETEEHNANLDKDKNMSDVEELTYDEELTDDEEQIRRKGLIDHFEDYGDLRRLKIQDNVHYLFIINSLKIIERFFNEQRDNFEGETKEKCKNIIKVISINLKDEQSDLTIDHQELLKGNLWSLSEKDRWALYKYWIRKIKTFHSEAINQEQEKYSTYLEKFKELQTLNDCNVIQTFKSKIVGLTTTGAARLHDLLTLLKPTVIVIEEAAEVLEAHIVVSLTHSCQHLILIGDHKQLRPNPSTFKLAKDYNLDISFFERMIHNGVGCSTLNVQHRMKPNIASLISPLVYPDLINHESVEKYPSVLGVLKNLYFVNHKVLERKDCELLSRLNQHEAEFLIALCRYLLQQGYYAEDVTILTLYSSQQFYLKELQKKEELLRNVRITVVDNYQGEECKIILLSLVRSNEEGRIGFLATENRICVALSRAKHALYIIGNMDLLKSKSDKWNSINSTLENHGAIGEQLALACQAHDTITYVSEAIDFHKVIKGGCQRICNRVKPCGHKCTLRCHPKHWVDHKIDKCNIPCNRKVCNEHNLICDKLCKDPCLKCTIQVVRTLGCGHEATLPCHQDPAIVWCLVLVDDVKPDCEHDVKRPCHINIEKINCPVPCHIRLDCGHACIKSCHINDDPLHLEYKCQKSCTNVNKNCKYDHPCQRKCYEECIDCPVLLSWSWIKGTIQTSPRKTTSIELGTSSSIDILYRDSSQLLRTNYEKSKIPLGICS